MCHLFIYKNPRGIRFFTSLGGDGGNLGEGTGITHRIESRDHRVPKLPGPEPPQEEVRVRPHDQFRWLPRAQSVRGGPLRGSVSPRSQHASIPCSRQFAVFITGSRRIPIRQPLISSKLLKIRFARTHVVEIDGDDGIW